MGKMDIRNTRIIQRHFEGTAILELAREFRITHQRIRAIIVSAGYTPNRLVNVKPFRPKPSRIDKFWSRVNKEPGQGPNGDCWEWQASRTPLKYGHLWWRPWKRATYAHHISYMLANRSRAKQWVLHKCDNPPCVNPDHLYDGTPKQNCADRSARTYKDRIRRPPRQLTGYLCKIEWDDVLAIRRRRSEGESITKMAREYGVTRQTIGGIVNNRFRKVAVRTQVVSNPNYPCSYGV